MREWTRSASDAGGDDDAAPEPAAARRAFFPSSMGLSLLVPRDAKELRVTVRWGDYQPPIKPADCRATAAVRLADKHRSIRAQLFGPADRAAGNASIGSRN